MAEKDFTLTNMQPKRSMADQWNISKIMEMTTKYLGSFKIYVQGTPEKGKVAFLTVHDVGSNHVPFCDFVACKAMSQVAANSVFYHVCLSGQDEMDADLAEDRPYPTLDAIAHDLIEVMDAAQLKAVIGLGEGAGANILLRFALIYANRCFGLILINCTADSAGVDEKLQSIFSHFLDSGRKLSRKIWTNQSSANGSGRQRGSVDSGSGSPPQTSPGDEFPLNQKNVEKYAEVYAKRSDINHFLATDLNMDCLILTGKLSPHKQTCEALVTHMNKLRTTLLVVDDARDVLYESETDTVRSLILFCKGCGVLIGVPMVGLEKEFSIVEHRIHGAPETEAQIELQRRIKIYENLLYA